jgi:hypothetical protein
MRKEGEYLSIFARTVDQVLIYLNQRKAIMRFLPIGYEVNG